MFKKISFIIAIIIVSGLSGIIADHYIFPYLADSKLFSKYDFLKKSVENTTVINKTEQVYVKEDSSVAKLTSPVVSSVVNIISYPNPDFKAARGAAAPETGMNGTGEIATSDGIVMTYASALRHEADPASTSSQPEYKYKVMTSDGNAYDADLLGIDAWSDLAFLKINASNLPVIAFGNAKDYEAGEKVIAISNDYPQYQNRFEMETLTSFDPTYNISGKNLNVPEKLEGVFRASFSADAMTAGGPVIDYSGNAIGIIGNTQRNGKNDLFIIPSDKVKAVLDRVIRKDLATEAVLGIYYLPVTKSLSLTQGLGADHGALVFSSSGQQGLAVLSGSPAQKAGLKLNDIITQINGEDVTLDNNLPSILFKFKKGDTVELGVMRDGQETKLNVQL